MYAATGALVAEVAGERRLSTRVAVPSRALLSGAMRRRHGPLQAAKRLGLSVRATASALSRLAMNGPRQPAEPAPPTLRKTCDRVISGEFWPYHQRSSRHSTPPDGPRLACSRRLGSRAADALEIVMTAATGRTVPPGVMQLLG